MFSPFFKSGAPGKRVRTVGRRHRPIFGRSLDENLARSDRQSSGRSAYRRTLESGQALRAQLREKYEISDVGSKSLHAPVNSRIARNKKLLRQALSKAQDTMLEGCRVYSGRRAIRKPYQAHNDRHKLHSSHCLAEMSQCETTVVSNSRASLRGILGIITK